jgi:hypothetical protein
MNDFYTIFLNDPFFFENVVYHVDGVAQKLIPAIIYRNKQLQRGQPGDRGAQSRPLDYNILIRISRVDIPIVTLHVNTVEIPLNYGDTILSSFHTAAIAGQDSESWWLGLKK